MVRPSRQDLEGVCKRPRYHCRLLHLHQEWPHHHGSNHRDPPNTQCVVMCGHGLCMRVAMTRLYIHGCVCVCVCSLGWVDVATSHHPLCQCVVNTHSDNDPFGPVIFQVCAMLLCHSRGSEPRRKTKRSAAWKSKQPNCRGRLAYFG